LMNPEAWGHLRERYETDRPRRLLACDGGGIRGVLTLQVLVELEARLARHYGRGDDFRLHEFFDYVAGTSTGAIIAAGIARGMAAKDVLEFYEDFGRKVFTKRWWGIWNSLYEDGPLERKLKQVYGENANLRPEHLETLLLVVARNATTDSAWPISTNPDAKYNDARRPDCNLEIPLWKLVRASTAAPVYFPPEIIEWEPGNPEKSFVFVDGGTTSYNNPAFVMTRMATEPAYRLRWPKGESKMLVISIGTGSAPALGADAHDPESNLLSSATNTLSSLMSQAAFDQDVNCRTVGRCTRGDPIDREVGDLVPRDEADAQIPLAQDLGRAFLYARYNAALTKNGLKDLGLGDIDPTRASKLDSVDAIPDLARIGQALAEQIDLADFGPFVDAPL